MGHHKQLAGQGTSGRRIPAQHIVPPSEKGSYSQALHVLPLSATWRSASLLQNQVFNNVDPTERSLSIP